MDVMKLLDSEFILGMFSGDPMLARERFRGFNERVNQDQCLEDQVNGRRFTDEEARKVIKKLLNGIEIAQVKSLPRNERSEILKKKKESMGCRNAKHLGF